MLAYRKAYKSRKNKQEAYIWNYNMEENIIKLKNDLKNKTYIHSQYKKIILFDSKKRYIHSPIFRDHIVHHMIHNILYEILDKKMINTSYACRKWYWAHKAIKYINNICKENNDFYYLKLDISKYFYSINHNILKQNIFKIIKNEDIRYVLSVVIDSYKTWNQFDNLFSQDSLYLKTLNKWLPIWSILSQLLANFYLHPLDHFVRHILKIKYYLRYMDDVIIIWKKEELKKIKNEIINFTYNDLGLTINPKKISFNPIKDWINFVWYRIFDSKIFVWKNIIKKTNKFLDELSCIDLKLLNDEDIKKIKSSLSSRFWSFFHTSSQYNYFSFRGNIDFHPRS